MKLLELIKITNPETIIKIIYGDEIYYQGLVGKIKIGYGDIDSLDLEVKEQRTHTYVFSGDSTLVVSVYQKN